jgi:hypothetical protein
VAIGPLYRACVLFVADNFEHMDYEGTTHNGLLWYKYSDAELQAIEVALVASKSQVAKMAMLPWFMQGLGAPFSRFKPRLRLVVICFSMACQSRAGRSHSSLSRGAKRNL